MSIRYVAVAALLAAALLTTGCADFKIYMKDRGNDFADCFKADIGPAIGADVHVLFTDAFSNGVGASISKKVGFKGRHAGTWVDVHLGVPIITAAPFILPDVFPGITDIVQVGYDEIEGKPVMIGGYNAGSLLFIYSIVERKGKHDHHTKGFQDMVNAFDVEIAATVGIVGTRVGFSFGQFVDFILGWFGVDIASDDENSIRAAGGPAKQEGMAGNPAKFIFVPCSARAGW